MKYLCCLGLATMLAPAHAADVPDVTVRFAGKPVVRRVLQRTPTYFGGDVEISAKVEVKDAAGKPIPNLTVTLSARTTRDGSIGRLRSYGYTDPGGVATSRVVFDLPTSSLKTSLQACLVDPADTCTPVTEIDLTKKTDIEVHFSHQQLANAGTQRIVRLGKVEDFRYGASINGYQVRPRFLWNVWERAGNRSGHSALTVFAESALSVNRTDDAFPIPKSTDVSFGQATAGATFTLASRVQGDISYGPPMRGRAGYSSAALTLNQPTGPRSLVFGSFGVSRAKAPSAPDAPRYGAEYGPQAGFTRLLKSGANRLTGWVQYTLEGQNRYFENGKPVLEPRQRSGSAGVSWAFHRGGPVYMQLDLLAGGFGGRARYYGASTTVTLRNMTRRLP
ncbi:MAG: hypothetical protein ACKV2U_10860 [Bryobacteraceae bacterium]